MLQNNLAIQQAFSPFAKELERNDLLENGTTKG